MGELVRTVLWRGLWRPGCEWCELASDGEGWCLGGTALVAVEGEPFQVRYSVRLDSRWATRAVEITVRQGRAPHERQLRLSVDRQYRWEIAREPAGDDAPRDNDAALSGLADVDLGFTPATNTLPIRRLAPAIGQGVDVTAAWVRFPELTVQPLPQRYTRLAERRYRYESNNGAFVAELEVDDLGLVVRYEGGWERVSPAVAIVSS
jgi:hypothetical protein